MWSRPGILAIILAFLAAGACPGAITHSVGTREKGPPGREPAVGWPTPRHNRRLTAIQPLPGRMSSAPGVVARVTFPRGRAALVPFASRPGREPDRAVALVDGGLRCYRLDGQL